RDQREQEWGQETKQRAQRSVQHDGGDLDLRVRQLGRHLDDQQHGDDDAEEAVDPRVRHLEARCLLEDAARLDAHAARRPDGDEQGDQADEPADQAAEESTHAIRDDEHDRKDVDPGHLTLPPVRHAIACEMRAGSHSLNLARCLFSSPSLMSAITLSTSASVRVRSGLRKVKVNAMLLWPSGTCGPWYSSKARACSRNSPAASAIAAWRAAAATWSSTTTARSRSIAGNLGSGLARGICAASMTGSTSISTAIMRPSSFAAART